MALIGRLLALMSVVWFPLAASRGLAGNSGLALARQICSECHAVERVQASSPNPAAPAFETIANVPGMTAVALAAALQSSHQTMPNVMLDANQRTDITAYILSLRRGN